MDTKSFMTKQLRVDRSEPLELIIVGKFIFHYIHTSVPFFAFWSVNGGDGFETTNNRIRLNCGRS